MQLMNAESLGTSVISFSKFDEKILFNSFFAHFCSLVFFHRVLQKKPLHLSRPNARIYFANNFVGAAFKVMELY